MDTTDDSAFAALNASLYSAVDSHNIANNNGSLFDLTTWSTRLDNAGKMVASATVSGVSSIYNSGVAVANWLGADAEAADTGAILSSWDSDLGQYYQQNRQGADALGFVLTSFIPGLAGVKILNAGQKMLGAAELGWTGRNLSRVTGLLSPATSRYTALAASDLAQSSAMFSSITGNTLKAVAAGYGQAALESAAFETAVAATMFKSPTLSEMDGWDIAKNIATGTVFGGIIGGSFTAAHSIFKIRSAVKAENTFENQFKQISENQGLSTSDRIIQRYEDIAATPSIPSTQDIIAGKYPQLNKIMDSATEADKPAIAQRLIEKYSGLAEDRLIKLNQAVRTDIHSLVTGGDTATANAVADAVQGMDSNQAFGSFLHSVEMARPGVKMAAEKSLIKRVASVALFGEDTGKVSFDAQPIPTIADSFTAKELKNSSIEDLVTSKVRSYKFKESIPFDVADIKNSVETTQARYIWADKFAKISYGMAIHEGDIPLQEVALAALQKQSKEGSNAMSVWMVPRNGMPQYAVTTLDDLAKTVQVNKQEAAQELIAHHRAGNTQSYEEISRKTNMSKSFLQGSESTDAQENYFVRQIAAQKLTQQLIAKGLRTETEGLVDLSTRTSFVKVAYDTSKVDEALNSTFVSDHMAYIKSKQNAYVQGVDNVLSQYAPEELQNMWHPTDTSLLKVNKFGAGAGLASSANSSYGSIGAWTESTGQSAAKIQKQFRERLSAATESPAYKLANNQEAAVEFAALNNYLLGTSERYVLADSGDKLVSRSLKQYQDAVAAGEKNLTPPKLQEGALPEIPIKNLQTLEAVNTHIELNSRRANGLSAVENASGIGTESPTRDPNIFYPYRPSERDYKFYALVVDPTVTGAGRKSMVYATSAKELSEKIDKVPGAYETYTGPALDRYFKANGNFDFSQTLHDHYIDSSLANAGVSGNFFLPTDPQKIVKDWMDWHKTGEDIFARELVSAKFGKEFAELRRLGEQYSDVALSKKGLSNIRFVEATTENPFVDYVKTALNISKIGEHPWISGANNLIDSVFSRSIGVVQDAFKTVKSPADLENVNSLLQKYGVKSAYYDAATELLANSSPNRGALTTFVRGANTVLSTFTLRLDWLNAVNNAVGANVLLSAETNDVIKKIMQGSDEVVGALKDLAHTVVPGTSDTVLSSAKLISNAFKNFISTDTRETWKPIYKQMGVITDITAQHDSMLDNIASAGTSSSTGELSKKLADITATAKQWAQTGEKWTGNTLAEEMNRFVAADVMRQISDVAVEHGIISRGEQVGYIRTFVNRTQGNTLASQRPLMFQGPVGSAIGLFQSYQFNLMQQMFRYVGEGSAKDTAMMLGMQGTLYGMNGLPGFQFINQHIVGTASGNTAHTDLYSSTYGVAGKQLGDWMTYGVASNMLQTNLYTRGDINPRSLTVVPTNIADIPLVSAFSKFFGNVKETAQKIGQGGNVWETILQGIEHNGISRPLSGVAQTLQVTTGGKVISTDNKGNISASNDLLSLSTLSRLAGGKPFDEAIATDATFRVTAYKAADADSKKQLSETIRTSLINGQTPSQDQITSFAHDYAATGGKQKDFNAMIIKLQKTTNIPQSQAIATALRNPYSGMMQRIMGGTEEE